MDNPNQLDIFTPAPGLVGHDHPDTSVIAAGEVEPRTGTQRRQVLEFLRGLPGGATDAEMQTALAMPGNTQRPRRIELVNAGLVWDSGIRRSKGGRPAIVWVCAVTP